MVGYAATSSGIGWGEGRFARSRRGVEPKHLENWGEKGDAGDMRHLRLTFGLAAGLCAFVLAVSPALAHEFVASKSGPLKGVVQQGSSKETTIGPNTQQIKLGTFKVYCNKAVAKGAATVGSSKTFATSVKFNWCWTPVKFGSHTSAVAVHMVAALAIEYHANGFVET
ncbi:MAG TPA: hypothetical protein VF706_02165, partial [Solirubrobacteraceae bacterium]